jgi:cation transport ATPase
MLLIDGQLCGYLGFADEIRPEVRFFIQLLQYRRKRVVIFSAMPMRAHKFVATELELRSVLWRGFASPVRSDGAKT